MTQGPIPDIVDISGIIKHSKNVKNKKIKIIIKTNFKNVSCV